MNKFSTLGVVMLVAMTTFAFGQSKFSEVNPDHRGTNIRRSQPPQVNRGGLTFFTNQATFEAAAPGLTQEDFSSTVVAPNNICTDFSPLSSTAHGACFGASDLQPGWNLNMSTTNDDYAFLTTGFLGAPTDIIGPNTFTDDMILNFDGFSAVGLDIFGDIVGAVNLDLEIYGAGGLLGTTSVVGSLGGQFWGVISAEPITQIVFIGQGGSDAELIGNLQYGDTGCDITGISVNNEGSVALSGSCPDGAVAYIWSSTSCGLTSVNNGNATYLGTQAPGTVVDFPFHADSCYYAADAAGNVLAISGQTVPTLGEWAMIAFVTLLMLAGMAFMRKRRLA